MSKTTRGMKIDKLSELLEKQRKTLKERGCFDDILHHLAWLDREVISACLGFSILSNRIPFVPVITQGVYEIKDLMAMVKNGKNKGGVLFQLTKPVANAVGSEPYLRTYPVPYYALDIEMGALTKGLGAERARKRLLKLERSPLTAEECISLCVHTDILSIQNRIFAAGSIYGSEEEILEIHLYTPTPHFDRTSLSCTRDGIIPSCRMRIG